MIALWAEQPREDFDDLPADAIAILPPGATEQHRPHLVYCGDTSLSEAVLARVQTTAHVWQLPPLSITKSDEHAAHAGTLTLSADTMLAVLRDTAASLARTQVRRLVFFNVGNSALPGNAVAAAAPEKGEALLAATAAGFGAWLEDFATFELPGRR